MRESFFSKLNNSGRALLLSICGGIFLLAGLSLLSFFLILDYEFRVTLFPYVVMLFLASWVCFSFAFPKTKTTSYADTLIDRPEEAPEPANIEDLIDLPMPPPKRRGHLINDIIDAYRDDERKMEKARVGALRSAFWGQIMFVAGAVVIPLAAFATYKLPVSYPSWIEENLFFAAQNDPKIALDAMPYYQGDWHILLAIGSVGFLALATAAGLMKESRHKMNIYFRLSVRVATMKRFLLSAQLARRLDNEPEDEGHLRGVATAIILKLLEGGEDNHLDIPDGNDPSVEMIKTILDKVPTLKRGSD